MGVIAWIVLGLIVGLIADKVMGSPHGPIITTLIGIAGALLGGWIADKLFHVNNIRGFFNLSTWVTALAGAVVLLAVVQLATNRGSLGTSRRRGLRH
ncbi:GlsB/YeaQ/YmgE family stress response membrane protein [Catenulispora yoronensis]|uniref:GlsB/YeaQ/YmgE family stress response membrane protein n=1 Tax=Catenulispora yoronensis TaxID=450799 RepID=A0ABN2V875_9ACTN